MPKVPKKEEWNKESTALLLDNNAVPTSADQEEITDEELSKLGFSKEEYDVCNYCGYRPTYKGNLKVHIDSVHKKIKHKCEKCGKYFAQKSSLKLHQRSVHEKISYPCVYCLHKATTNGNLNHHIAKVHQVNTYLQ